MLSGIADLACIIGMVPRLFIPAEKKQRGDGKMKRTDKEIVALGRTTAQKAVDVVSWPYCYEAKLSKDARKKLLRK